LLSLLENASFIVRPFASASTTSVYNSVACNFFGWPVGHFFKVAPDFLSAAIFASKDVDAVFDEMIFDEWDRFHSFRNGPNLLFQVIFLSEHLLNIWRLDAKRSAEADSIKSNAKLVIYTRRFYPPAITCSNF
jgi:hypothetical protein